MLSFRIRERKSAIQDILNFTAEKLGVTPDELFDRIQNGTADELLAAYEGKRPDLPEELSSEE
ncbi:MAG: hypothetical protein HC895_00230 [Leptolyngbyaceae cyanobacterium SM1_3_5]|nr:hypothetical protein [Leptolyngbyaceae cyanobacterium SM1_3_5]